MIAFMDILSQMIEKTDLMYQALKVDDVDVFIEALEAREALIQMLKNSGVDIEAERAQYADLYAELINLDQRVNQEMKSSQSRLKTLMTESQKEQVRVKHFDAKASKYVEAGNQMSGHYFDKKK